MSAYALVLCAAVACCGAVSLNKVKPISSTAWSPSSWQTFPIKQPPNYPDQVCMAQALCGSMYVKYVWL